MLKIVALVMALVSGLAGHASAYGRLALQWDECQGFNTKTFVCESNQGSEELHLIFASPYDLPEVVGIEMVVTLASASAVYPSWWRMKSGTADCRSGAMTVHTTALGNAFTCEDWAQGLQSGGLMAYDYPSSAGSNSARMTFQFTAPASAHLALRGNQGYIGARLSISHAKSVAPTGCSGCLTAMCIALQTVKVNSADPLQSRVLTATDPYGWESATWQAIRGYEAYAGIGCPAAVPVRRSTWGAVKSLYR